MNYCPFCHKKLLCINPGITGIEYCDNHEPVLLLIASPQTFYLCKQQYEIYVGHNITALAIHKKYELKELQDNPKSIKYSKITRNGYLYSKIGTRILKSNQQLPVTPDNLDHYVKKT